MDEILFRSSQKFEHLQVQMKLVASHFKDVSNHYSEQSRAVVLHAWNTPHLLEIRHNLRQLWQYVLSSGSALRHQFLYYANPQRIYQNLANAFWGRWTARDVYFMTAGFICGSIVGVVVTLAIRRKNPAIRYMQALQCTHYLGIESATVVENAIAPSYCGPNEVLVDVKAASVHVVDAQICSGYGRTIRRVLRKLYKQSDYELPVTLGRDCTGVITDVGQNIKRLEIGDEVWLTVPFWSEGTLAQTVLVPEYRVGKKPQNVGFEGACSLPYAGSLALNALNEVNITSENAQGQRVLVMGGCTPVGCILIQILKHWKASITATCFKRALPVAKALGASDIIVCPELDSSIEKIQPDEFNAFEKQLELRDRFDTIIITRDSVLPTDIKGFCKTGTGNVISTLPPDRVSDSLGILGGFIFEVYIHVKYYLEKIIGVPMNDFDEAHLCYVSLNELSELVESGRLQTVVDKVFHPQDIELALGHIESQDSIGSTVITFR